MRVDTLEDGAVLEAADLVSRPRASPSVGPDSAHLGLIFGWQITQAIPGASIHTYVSPKIRHNPMTIPRALLFPPPIT